MQRILYTLLASSALWGHSVPALAEEMASAPAVLAEQQGESAPIIVTARRREENIQDVPQTVVAVSGRELEALNLFSFEDLSKVVPGVSLSRAGGITTVRGVSFNPTAQTNSAVAFYMNEGPVQPSFIFQSMFDIGQIETLKGPQGTIRGQSAPTGAITLTTRRPDLEQIGGYAMGTITDDDGRTLQGAVNVPLVNGVLGLRLAGISDRTDNGGIRSANSSVDPYSETNAFRISVRAEPVNDLSAVFTYQRLTNESLGFGGAVYGRGAAGGQGTGTPGFNTAARQTGYAGRFRQPVGYNGPPIFIGSRQAVAENPDYAKTRQEFASGQIDYRFGGLQMSYVGAWSHNDGSPATNFGDNGNMLVGDFPGRNLDSDLTRWTHELRLASTERIGGIADFVVGVFHLDEKTANLANNGLSFQPGAFGTPLGAPLAIAPNLRFATASLAEIDNRLKEWSFFGNVTLHLTDDTELSGGIRFINAEKDSVRINTSTAGFRSAGNVTTLPACAAAGGTLGTTYAGVCDIPVAAVVAPPIVDQWKKSPVVYSATLSHRFTPEFMAYASFGTSWRPGPTQGNIINGTNDPVLASFQALDDETTDSFEVGVKHSMFNDLLRINFALYYQKYKNLVFSDLSAIRYVSDNGQGVRQLAAAVPLNYNVDAKVPGIDFDATYQVSDRFFLSGGASWNDGKFKNQLVPCNDGNFDGVPDAGAFSVGQFPAGVFLAQCNRSGRSSPTPKWNATFRADVSHPIGGDMEFFTSGLLTYTGKNPYADPTYTTPAFALVNVNLGVRDVEKGWEIQGFVRNLLNSNTITGISTSPQSDLIVGSTMATLFGNSGYRTVSYQRPREVGLTVRYAFGSR